MDSSLTYILILILSLLYPLAQSFERRLKMYKRAKYIFPGIFFTAVLFIIWDVLFTKAGVWGFNHSYTLDYYFLGLPLEEWLFFLIIPYCIFFTHEVLRYFIKNFNYPKISRIFIWTLLIANTLALPFVWTKTYTFTAMAFVIPFLALQLIIKSYKTWFSWFMLTYLVSFVPFILVNGFLTRIPVVWYNNAENLGLRITTIPIEDFIYLLGMLLPTFTIYHWLQDRNTMQSKEKDSIHV